jgi:16S rRNA (cytosine1402-N4)-methyltransferase
MYVCRVVDPATTTMHHKPVLVSPILNILKQSFNNNSNKLQIFVDATVGLGGHTKPILQEFQSTLKHIYCIDRDNEILNLCKSSLITQGYDGKEISFHHSSYQHVSTLIQPSHHQQINAILFDLGVNSIHLDDSTRGFSFKTREQNVDPILLDMRFDRSNNNSNSITARDILNTASEYDLGFVLREYGEEPNWRHIARTIVSSRIIQPINTIKDLQSILSDSSFNQKKYNKKKNPLTLILQALRIKVNNEFEHLQIGLDEGFKLLANHGIMLVISFHSGEDRIVKKTFEKFTSQSECISKKPIIPNEEEIHENKRSRSAKLRWIIKKN